MDYSFLKTDMVVKAICECCSGNESDHVFVQLKGIGILVAQMCYKCVVHLELHGMEYAIIPKKNARFKYERYSPMCNPRKQSSSDVGEYQGNEKKDL
jgi:hypothetical protein